jgi:hypothetical protein
MLEYSLTDRRVDRSDALITLYTNLCRVNIFKKLDSVVLIPKFFLLNKEAHNTTFLA